MEAELGQRLKMKLEASKKCQKMFSVLEIRQSIYDVVTESWYSHVDVAFA